MLGEPSRLSYNNWLREQSRELSNQLPLVTENLLVELQGLQLACQSEITMEPSRALRVIAAMEKTLVEIHLLAILKPHRKEGV